VSDISVSLFSNFHPLISATSPGRASSRHMSDLKSMLQSNVEPTGLFLLTTCPHQNLIVAYTRAQFIREEKIFLSKVHPKGSQPPLHSSSSQGPPISSPSQGRLSLTPDSSKRTPLLSKETSIAELLSVPENSNIQSAEGVTGSQINASSADPVRTAPSTPGAVARKVITKRGSSMGLGSVDGSVNTTEASSPSTQPLNSNPKQATRGSIAAISSIITGAMGGGGGNHEPEMKKRSFTSSILPGRRLSTHQLSAQGSSWTSPHLKEDNSEDESSSSSSVDEIEIQHRQRPARGLPSNQSSQQVEQTREMEKRCVVDDVDAKEKGREEHEEEEEEGDGQTDQVDSLRVQFPSTRSEQSSYQTLSSHLQSGSERGSQRTLEINSQQPKFELLSPQFLRPKGDSDSSVPPTRRRHHHRRDHDPNQTSGDSSHSFERSSRYGLSSILSVSISLSQLTHNFRV
jgi:hypothetical protein